MSRLALLLVSAIGLAACSSAGTGSAGPDVARELPVAVATTRTAPETVPSPGQQMVASAFEEAVGVLVGGDGVRLTFEGAEEGYVTTGWVEMDLRTGEFHSTEDELYDTGERIRSEFILVGDEIHARLAHGGAELGDLDWTVEPVEPALRQEFVDEALTLTGRGGGSLERIVRYLNELPFDVIDLGRSEVGERTSTGRQVIFEAADISQLLRMNGLELVGPSDPPGQTYYEFWVDEATGALTRLALAGVQFHDGEALEGFGGRIDYEVSVIDLDAPG
ncbi:MAG: hypothetical protein OEW42_14425 [Acidimicrobiia bacterium]|nr:hypothetical protein [Acidimicrobiia bacterium]